MNNNILKPLCYVAIAMFAIGCTDLAVEETDSLVVETDEGFLGLDPADALNASYGDLRSFGTTQADVYALAEVTSDELLVPTRGVDWGDNGTWRALHLQNWTPTHNFILNAWNQLNGNVFRTNQALHEKTNPNAQQAAEAKFLRAFNMYWILDFWGQAPFREADEGVEVTPRVFNAQQTFDFIIKDLTEALPVLPALGPGAANALQANKANANFLLAKMYLNKHIFLGTGTAAEADMQKVVEHVDAITALGFDIKDEYFDIFNRNERDNNPELILWTTAAPAWRIWHGLHYNQKSPTNMGGGWNGFSTTSEFYSLFEGDPGVNGNLEENNQEERRGFVRKDGIGYGFLIGQQYGLDGEALQDRSSTPLVYTPDFPNGLTGNNEKNGIRIIKYHPDVTTWEGYYILMRYSDAHLMKAEALARMGDMPAALALVNELRALREATPLATLELNDILDERGRELYIEGWRRNDQIRFGTFTEAHELKPATEEFRRLFPIPATALTTNPDLVQNEGY